jgi:phospholipase/carboxylesterase
VPTLSGPSCPTRSGNAATSVVILLHGRGSNGDDLSGLVDVIGDALPDTVFYSPNAPFELGGFGFVWYEADPSGGRERGLREIEPVINEFISELLEEYGLPPSKCALIGFSQGTIVSMHVAPRRTEQLAGVVGFSGAMFTGDSLASELASKPPFVLVHGEEDSVLASRETESAGKRFEEVGVPVEMHILPGLTHSIDKRGLDIGVEFLQRVLA